MRIVVGIIFWLVVGASAQAQVINGEGNFESNRGFDRTPEEAQAAKTQPKPSQIERPRDERGSR